MENKINLFRDNQGCISLIGANGNDFSVLDINSTRSEEAITEEDKNRIAHLIEQEQFETLEHCNLMFRIGAP